MKLYFHSSRCIIIAVMDIIQTCKDNLRYYDELGWDKTVLPVDKEFAKKANVLSKDAAVLIALFVKNDKIHVILTRRSYNVATHKGHVSFPGGKSNDKDSDLVETALRETYEEIGIDVDNIDVIAKWRPTIARDRATRYIVYPVIAILKPGFQTKVDENEVAEIFDVPLEFFLQSETHKVQFYEHLNTKVAVHFYEYFDESKQCLFFIWGLTANLCLKAAVIVLKKLPVFEIETDHEKTNFYGFIRGEKPTKKCLNSKI